MIPIPIPTGRGSPAPVGGQGPGVRGGAPAWHDPGRKVRCLARCRRRAAGGAARVQRGRRRDGRRRGQVLKEEGETCRPCLAAVPGACLRCPSQQPVAHPATHTSAINTPILHTLTHLNPNPWPAGQGSRGSRPQRRRGRGRREEEEGKEGQEAGGRGRRCARVRGCAYPRPLLPLPLPLPAAAAALSDSHMPR